jgi:predicted ATPase/class 3 adenylate cyclase
MTDHGLYIPEGFSVISTLYKDESHEIIKAVRLLDQLEVVLKISRPVTNDILQISKLSHEYNTLKSLDHEGVINVFSLYSKGKAICIEEEYFNGETLKARIFKQPFSVKDFFYVARQLTDILTYVHSQGIIHKDINSNNILISDSNKVKAIDFGISSNFMNEEQDVLIPDKIEGTLTYISPEQTGRTSYAITAGSDLYSLGIVFYEMLSGKLPFDSADPLEVIHFHLSRTPAALSKIISGLPKGIEHVINDLLEKVPDDRYQSAAGVKSDLIELEELISQGKSTNYFKTKLKDRGGRFRKTQRLYGRETEIKALLDAYDHLGQSRSLLVLVSGYSGVGKSAVIKQLQKPISEKKGLYLSGKFDQFKRNIPYFAFIEAFDELIKNILSQSDDKIAIWKSKILKVLDTNASLITEVIPDLEHIIGQCPPAFKLQPAEQEFRFRLVLLDFVLCFSSEDAPLVIFLDDLQWSDLPSLNLLERILNHPGEQQVLVVGTYRSNEVTDAHPLRITIQNIKDEGIQVKDIALQPLDEPTTLQIVFDSFGMSAEQANELGKHVYSKTKGNPFFVNRFLQTLYDNRFVYLNSFGNWNWDQKAIETLDYTDNVIDLMTKELTKLPENTQSLMSKASVIGNTFNLTTLSHLTGTTHLDVFQILQPALSAGYILPTSQNYRSLTLYDQRFKAEFDLQADALANNFKFLHDRVQQASYAIITEQQRDEIHLQTARVIYNHTPQNKINDYIFDIASHYSESLTLVSSPDEKLQIARIFLLAGTKAKDSTSYDVAVRYLNLAKSLLDESSWEKNYDLTFKVYSELSECEYLNNNHEGAERLFEQTRIHAKTKLEKLKTYYVHSSLYLKIGNTSKSLQLGREAMKLYDIRFPESKQAIKATAIMELSKYLLLFSTKYKNVEKLYHFKECKDPEIIAINQFLIDLSTSAYQENQDLMLVVVLRIIRFYLKYGFTDASDWGFAGLSTVVYSALGMHEKGFKLWNLTIKLHLRTRSPLIKNKEDYTINAFHSHWGRPLQETADEFTYLVKSSLVNGDPGFAAYSISELFWKRTASGMPLQEVVESTKDYIQYLDRTKNGIGQDFTTPVLNMVLCLLGKSSGEGMWQSEKFNSSQFLDHLITVGNKTSLGFYYNARLPLYYFFHDYNSGLKWLDEGEPYQTFLLGHHCVSEWSFYSNLLISAAYESMTAPDKKKYLKKFKTNIKWFRLWVKGCAVNYEQQLFILLAEEKTMQGDTDACIKLYEMAIKSSVSNGYLQYGAIANERAHIHLEKVGITKQADNYLKDAYTMYEAWGAQGKCKMMARLRPDLFGDKNLLISGNTRTNLSIAALDYGSLIKASHSISSTIKLDELIQRLMNVLLENAGAQRGVLLIPKQNQLFAIAEGIAGPENMLSTISVPMNNYGQYLPEALINYCWRTLEIKSFANASKDTIYGIDPYVKANQVKSMICIPLTNKGSKVGLIYLENKLLEGVFTANKLEVLNMLSGQIGISIDNSLLYENLESKVAERTRDLEKQKQIAEAQTQVAIQQKQLAETERKKSDVLLLNILPEEVAQELKTNGESKARHFDAVTVILTDFVNFTSVCETLSPTDLVFELNKCFAAFDQIIDKHELEKIKTIGDAYLAVAGLPRRSPDHALRACHAVIDILNWVKDPANQCIFDIRVGINSGPVIAGIVGVRKYVYDIWGDTVNTTSRLESASIAGKINISESTYQMIKDHFTCNYRGEIEAKNKGNIKMYFLEPPTLITNT